MFLWQKCSHVIGFIAFIHADYADSCCIDWQHLPITVEALMDFNRLLIVMFGSMLHVPSVLIAENLKQQQSLHPSVFWGAIFKIDSLHRDIKQTHTHAHTQLYIKIAMEYIGKKWDFS